MVTQPTKRKITIYIEGGGDGASLKSACRQGFSALLNRAGLAGRMPAVVACGGRDAAYKRYCAAVADAGPAELMLLLVDSEAPVTHASPWQHLKHRGDPWVQPPNTTDEHCHLMTQCMETWLVADAAEFAKFFGNGFRASAMPSRNGAALEQEPKLDLYAKIATATAACKTKAPYGKGEHSFKILALVDPALVRQLPWAARFFTYLDQVA